MWVTDRLSLVYNDPYSRPLLDKKIDIVGMKSPSVLLIKESYHHIDGLAQDVSNFSALAMGLLQSCTKPSI